MSKPHNGEDILAHDIFEHRQVVAALLEAWKNPKLRPLLEADRAEILRDCQCLINALAEPDRATTRELMQQYRESRRRTQI